VPSYPDDSIESYWEGIRPSPQELPVSEEAPQRLCERKELVGSLIIDSLSVELIRRSLTNELGRQPTILELAELLDGLREGELEELNNEVKKMIEVIRSGDSEAHRSFHETLTHLQEWPPGVPADQRHLVPSLEEARELVHGGHFFERPLAPAEPQPPSTSGEDLVFDSTESILSRLTNDLGVLGFPPESISIQRSIEGGTSLTIHMPVTLQTQLTGPGHSSVTFTHS
jgi:hypothetical protein